MKHERRIRRLSIASSLLGLSLVVLGGFILHWPPLLIAGAVWIIATPFVAIAAYLIGIGHRR